jgi:DNA-binding transcriptional regulator PaaX
MVRPRLRQLEDGGLITRQRDGRGAIYELTEAGRAELRRREDELRLVEVGVRRSLRVLTELIRDDVRATVAELRQELRGGSGKKRSRPPYTPSGLDGDRQRLYDELLQRTERVRALLTHFDPADGQLGRAMELLNHAFDEAESTLMSARPA